MARTILLSIVVALILDALTSLAITTILKIADPDINAATEQVNRDRASVAEKLDAVTVAVGELARDIRVVAGDIAKLGSGQTEIARTVDRVASGLSALTPILQRGRDEGKRTTDELDRVDDALGELLSGLLELKDRLGNEDSQERE